MARFAFIITVVALAIAVAAPAAAAGGTISVFAAASLREAFEAAAPAFQGDGRRGDVLLRRLGYAGHADQTGCARRRLRLRQRSADEGRVRCVAARRAG